MEEWAMVRISVPLWLVALLGIGGMAWLIYQGIERWVVKSTPNPERALRHKRMRRALYEWLWRASEEGRRDGIPMPCPHATLIAGGEMELDELRTIIVGK